jgi:hypothetical protein
MDVQYVVDSRSSEIPDEKGNPWSMVSDRVRKLLGSTGKFLSNSKMFCSDYSAIPVHNGIEHSVRPPVGVHNRYDENVL